MDRGLVTVERIILKSQGRHHYPNSENPPSDSHLDLSFHSILPAAAIPFSSSTCLLFNKAQQKLPVEQPMRSRGDDVAQREKISTDGKVETVPIATIMGHHHE